MLAEDVLLLLKADPSELTRISVEDGPKIYARNDGEQIFLMLDTEWLTGKEFKQADMQHRLRRIWTRVFGSKPPF